MTPLNNGCHAAWYELNISAPDNCVSACCYYAGEKDPWSDDFVDVQHYWNSAAFQKIREINVDRSGRLSGGCDGCFLFKTRDETARYTDVFEHTPADLSPAQLANLEAAREDYEQARTVLSCTPLRYYINFGFACNLSCIMCHQVPRRKKNKRQASADVIMRWREGLKQALDISVIGGEPFVLKEARDFMKAVVADRELDPVRMTVLTNGTVHHKHLDWLQAKRKLHFAISLDTMAETFEKIRVGASWDLIDRNIELYRETGRKLGYDWTVTTSCLLLKTGLPRLADFARWSVERDIRTGFFDFIVAPGVEKTYSEENYIAHPAVLDDAPQWRDQMLEAEEVLEGAGWEREAGQLRFFRKQIEVRRAAREAAQRRATRVTMHQQWDLAWAWSPEILDRFGGLQIAPVEGAEPAQVVRLETDGAVLTPVDPGDHVTSPFARIDPPAPGKRNWVRLRCGWSRRASLERLAMIAVQTETFEPVTAIKERWSEDGGKVWEAWYEVPEGTQGLRVMMASPDLDPVWGPQLLILQRAEIDESSLEDPAACPITPPSQHRSGAAA